MLGILNTIEALIPILGQKAMESRTAHRKYPINLYIAACLISECDTYFLEEAYLSKRHYNLSVDRIYEFVVPRLIKRIKTIERRIKHYNE